MSKCFGAYSAGVNNLLQLRRVTKRIRKVDGMELQLVIDKIYQSWDARSTITFHLGGRRLYTGKWIWIGESTQDGAFVMSSDLRHRYQTDVKRYSTSSSDRNFILKKGGDALWETSIYLYSHNLFAWSAFPPFITPQMLCRVLTLRKIYNTITLPPLQHFI